MNPYAIARRSFLRGAGASLGLRTMLRTIEAGAAGAAPPQRLLVMHRPVGTIRSQWIPAGSETAFSLAPIMAPFEPVRSSMVVLDGLAVKQSGVTGSGPHEAGMVTIMTGAPIASTGGGNGSNDAIASAASIDQILQQRAPALQGTPFASLQLAADGRNQFNNIANRAASYSGPAAPLYPELSPLQVYSRIFGTFMPGSNVQQIERLRARKASVLDFIRRDLARLQAMAPTSERDKLDAHASAIRELEQSFDMSLGTGTPTTCGKPATPTSLTVNTDQNYALLAKQHLAVVRAAFACDLTRVATFMWAACTSNVSFEGLFAGMPRTQHHPASHNAGTDDLMAAIDTWYSARTAEFIADLRNTPEGAGNLLDNTLVVYFSDVSYGNNHSLVNLPFLLFGGAGVRLRGNRFVTRKGRSTNDLWLAAAPVFGANLTTLGNPVQYAGPLPGIFE